MMTKDIAAKLAEGKGSPEKIRALRLGELKRVLRHRYGPELPDDDAGRDDLELLLDVVSLLCLTVRSIGEGAWAETPDAVKLALQQETQQLTAAQQQYQQAIAQAHALSRAAVLAAPELAGVDPAQIGTALTVLSKTNPQRAAEIQQQLSRTEALYNEGVRVQQESQQRQAAVAQQNLKTWIENQDAEFERTYASKESPQLMKEIAQNAIELAQEYGISKQELGELWNSQPLMRSSAMQKMMSDAARYRMAQKGIAEKVHKPVPPVNRPGVAPAHGVDHGVEKAMADFRKAPSALSAAALLTARRAAKR